MIETLAVYLIVVTAAGWTVWRLFPPLWFRRRASARFAAARRPDCTCDGR